MGVSRASPGVHPNFPQVAGAEGTLLALGGASRASCPRGEGIPSTPYFPPHRQGFSTSAEGPPVPSPKGSAWPLDTPQGCGLTGRGGGTAWWARRPSSLLQTPGLEEQGSPARRLESPGLCPLQNLVEVHGGEIWRRLGQGCPRKLALVAGEAADFLPSPQGGAAALEDALLGFQDPPVWALQAGPAQGGCPWALPRRPQPHPHYGRMGRGAP